MSQPPRNQQPLSPRPANARPATAAPPAPGFVASDLTNSVAARVQDILASAHETAEGVREQAAAATRDMLAQAQATVDRDTERIRRDVEARAAQYLAECHRRVDTFADARVRRLRELSDSLIEQTDALSGRFDQVVRLKQQLDGLIASLGAAAEQTAREVKRPEISLPTLAQFHGESGYLAPPPPAAAPPVEPGDTATTGVDPVDEDAGVQPAAAGAADWGSAAVGAPDPESTAVTDAVTDESQETGAPPSAQPAAHRPAHDSAEEATDGRGGRAAR
jgi:hypothetical protein